MAGVILTGLHPKALWPGVEKWFGIGYGEHPEQYRDLFEVIEKPNRAYVEDVMTGPFPMLPAKPQGNPVSYMTHAQVYTTRYTFVTYAGGFQVSEEEIEFNLYADLAASRAKGLGFAKRQTVETISANVYNRAFNTSYLGGDGVVLCATTHPSAVGNWSNLLSPAADMSEAALEDLVIQILQAEDHIGNKIQLMAESLHVPPALWIEANRILKSTLQNDTANNAINVLRVTGEFPKGIKVNNYFTDSDAFFARTNCPDGMKFFNSKDVPLQQANDFDTGNAKAKTAKWFVPGWSDPRALYASPGA